MFVCTSFLVDTTHAPPHHCTNQRTHTLCTALPRRADPTVEKQQVDPYEQARKMAKVVNIQISRNLLTEDVVDRIIGNRLKYEKRNAKRSQKELAYLDKREFVAEI
jgi:hypothetical protein